MYKLQKGEKTNTKHNHEVTCMNQIRLHKFTTFLRSGFFKTICIILCITIITCTIGVIKATEAPANATEVLSKLGSRGDEVRKIQTKLKMQCFGQ